MSPGQAGWRERVLLGDSRAEERAEVWPCDAVLPGAGLALFRAVDVAAPVPLVFRWLCQLRAAPYSYDWIDNLGRRSPRTLTPGLEQLEVGQRVMTIFRLVAFREDDHLTLETDGALGPVAVSYRVRPGREGAEGPEAGTRLAGPEGGTRLAGPEGGTRLAGPEPEAGTRLAGPEAGTRLAAKLLAAPPGGLRGALVRRLLPAGDWIMMQKQLRTLKGLAERDARPTG